MSQSNCPLSHLLSRIRFVLPPPPIGSPGALVPEHPWLKDNSGEAGLCSSYLTPLMSYVLPFILEQRNENAFPDPKIIDALIKDTKEQHFLHDLCMVKGRKGRKLPLK